MFPFLEIGIFKIPMFATMILLGLIGYTLLTIYIFEKKEKQVQKTTNRVLIISVLGVAACGIFAFLFNSLFHSIEEGELVLGGITWLGGIFGAFPILIIGIHFFCPRIKGNALFYFNLLIPAIALAHGFGRIGCFLGGCCFGCVTDSFLGVQFPVGSHAAHLYPAADGRSLPLYPTQLFEAIFELITFAVMMIFYKKLREHFFEMYCFGYGLFRFLMEFLRGDNRGATGFVFSPSQLMSVLLIIVGVLLVLYNKNKIFKKLYAKMENYRKQTELNGGLSYSDIKGALKRLKDLQNEGLITEEEYAQAEQTLQERIDKIPLLEEK